MKTSEPSSSSALTEFYDTIENPMNDLMENLLSQNYSSPEADESDSSQCDCFMQLLSSLITQIYQTLEALIYTVNKHVSSQGYTVVKTGQKKNKNEEIIKNLLKCSRGGKYKDHVDSDLREQTRAICTTGCKWAAYGRRDGTIWVLIIKNPDHNHPASPPEIYPAHRRMTEEDLKTVLIDRKRNLDVYQITAGLRMDNPDRFFKKQDIYNALGVIKRRDLSSLTPLQALLQRLEASEKWYIAYSMDAWDQLNRLFFAYQPALEWLSKYPDILFIDATYKTNRFNMPLVILTSTTACNKTFYVGFTFLRHKDIEYYGWVVSHIKIIWEDIEHSQGPITAVTDKEDALIETLEHGLSLTKLLLCQWHINKNVLARMKTGDYFSEMKTQQI